MASSAFVCPSYSRHSYTIPPSATISPAEVSSLSTYQPLNGPPPDMENPRRALSPLHAHRYENFPNRTSSLANSSGSASTSPTLSNQASSYQAPSYHTDASSYEPETSWFADSDNNSKAPSVLSPRDSVATLDHSCQFDANDWFAQFNGDIDISDDLPKRTELDNIADVPVYDAAGNSRAFRSLYSVGDVVGDRQLIIFIRHFYCGACQSYIRALTQQINMQTYFTMAIPTSIIVIGCGSPELIRMYKATTQCPFPIFADPSRAIFKQLGMSWSLDIGRKRPEYMKEISPPAWLLEQFKQMGKTRGFKKFRAGNWLQIGGEFLFENGEVVWCHRMKNYRNHAEIDVLKRVLEIDR